MKKVIIVVVGIITLFVGVFFFKNSRQQSDQTQDQVVLNEILNISREYAALRYRVDNVLINAKDFTDYDAWNNEMSAVISGWVELENNILQLEKSVNQMTKEKVSFKFIKASQAYTKEEITSIIDKAPMGKKIMTLANHLGVDAKMAQLVLNQSQDEMSREAYGEEGDIFKKLETQATVVKNASKVIVFVGTIAITGGTAAIASGGTLAQSAVVVSGADLTLEITDDAAKIALGDKNKISSIVGDVRKITEPVSAILMVSTLPTKLATGIDKLGAVTFGAEMLNSTIQSGSVVGIKLPVYKSKETEQKIEVSVLEKNEVNNWMKENGVSDSLETVEEIENILRISQSADLATVSENSPQTEVSEIKTTTQIEQANNDNNSEVSGVWKGILKHTPSQTASEKQIEFMIDLNNNGTVNNIGNGKAFSTWKKEGNSIKLFAKDDSGGYYEFSLSGDSLIFIKMAGPNSEGEWQEDLAGSDFFGGKFYEILLKKQ